MSTQVLTGQAALPAALACPPWCSKHRGAAGWDSVNDVEGIYKRCGHEFTPLEIEDGGPAMVRLDRYVGFEVYEGTPRIDVSEQLICLGDWMAMTPAQAERVAAVLLEATRMVTG